MILIEPPIFCSTYLDVQKGKKAPKKCILPTKVGKNVHFFCLIRMF